MPRRALAFITVLVLALHWLVLRGVPLAWNPPQQPADRVFSTRSIPAAVPVPGTSPPPAAAQPPRAEVPAAARPAPARKKRPPTAPPETAEATAPDPVGHPPQSAQEAPAALPAQGSTDIEDDSTVEPPVATPAVLPESAEPAAPPATATASAPLSHAPDTLPVAGGADIPPAPVRIPEPTRLTFDVNGQARKFTYHARAQLLWQHDGSRYEARQEISAFLIGSRTQRSTGQITPQGLLPERFSDKSRSEQAAHFDYAQGRVTFSANTPSSAVAPGAQDRLSVFIQLGALLAGSPDRFVPGSQITLTTVSARSADHWTFTIEGPETLELPIGTTPTIKLQRLPRKDYDQKAELWVAPDLGYLPVRIQLTQANGDFADLRLSSSATP